MNTTIQKWGNSQGIRLPKIILDDLNMHEGEKVELIVKNNSIIIKPLSKKRKNIKELFTNFEDDYKPNEIDWGIPVGDELW